MSQQDDDKIPLFKNWKGWYVLVIAFLLLMIVFFYFFTKKFS